MDEVWPARNPPCISWDTSRSINLVVASKKRHGDACHKLTYMIMDSFRISACASSRWRRASNASPRKYLRKIEVPNSASASACHRRGAVHQAHDDEAWWAARQPRIDNLRGLPFT